MNAIKWDPNGTLLASCSDDCTAKVCFAFWVSVNYLNLMIICRLVLVSYCNITDHCMMQVWSMKQNKYLHNLRGHEKVDSLLCLYTKAHLLLCW